MAPRRVICVKNGKSFTRSLFVSNCPFTTTHSFKPCQNLARCVGIDIMGCPYCQDPNYPAANGLVNARPPCIQPQGPCIPCKKMEKLDRQICQAKLALDDMLKQGDGIDMKIACGEAAKLFLRVSSSYQPCDKSQWARNDLCKDSDSRIREVSDALGQQAP